MTTVSLNGPNATMMVMTTTLTMLNDSVTQSEEAHTMNSGLLSDYVRYLFEAIFYSALCGFVSLFGIAANVINIVIFIRQGVMSDSSNVSLFALAVSDLCSLISLLWLSICFAIRLKEPPNLNWDPMSVLFMTAGLPHVIFAQITCWVTAFIAFERCMCVVFPFKMKTIFSAKRSATILPLIFLYNFMCFILIFITQRFQWEFFPSLNRTKLTIYFTEFYDQAQLISNYINSFFNRLFPIAVVLICTKITTSKVNMSSKFRRGVATSGVAKSSASASAEGAQKTDSSRPVTSQKEVKLVRMITMICLIFLICYCPDCFMVFLRETTPEIKHYGTYHNLFHVFYSTGFFLESVNSSINIIVYYKLSTRYRQEFRLWLGLPDESKTVK